MKLDNFGFARMLQGPARAPDYAEGAAPSPCPLLNGFQALSFLPVDIVVVDVGW